MVCEKEKYKFINMGKCMFDLLSSEPCTILIGWYVLLGA